MRTDDLAALTRVALEKVTEGDTAILCALRLQAQHSRISKIVFDGYGFYAVLEVDVDYRIRDPKKQNFELSDLVGFNERNQLSIGFVLFVRDGLLSTFEGFPFVEDEWPSECIAFKFAKQPSSTNATYSDTRTSGSVISQIGSTVSDADTANGDEGA